MGRRIVFVLIVIVFMAAAGWALYHFKLTKRHSALAENTLSSFTSAPDPNAWNRAVELVKADRAGEGAGALEIPPELKHYEERYWFLAAQVAEVEKYQIHTCQDYLDLASMIERGDFVPVAAVSDTYVLLGIGQRADDSPFNRYEDNNQSVELYNETQLADAYRQFDEKRTGLQKEIASLNAQAGKLTRRETSKRNDLQKQISSAQQQLQSLDEDKAQLDHYYGQADTRKKLFRDYESLQTLARNFNGRSYDLNQSSDRLALKMNLLSALRSQALKIMEEVAAAYHSQFSRPLPVSSLVRPEQYQHSLRRVNRNAVTIDSPPHSTGLAFDIDYRYMSVAEQNFLMQYLARLKNGGRIEVIRERNANYHVFAFMNGSRPADDLITASLEKAGAPPPEEQHAVDKPAPVERKRNKSTRHRGSPHKSSKRHR